MLLELVMGISLFSLVMLTVIELYPTSFVAHGRARLRTFASQLTENLLDRCSALPLATLLPPPKVFTQWDSSDPGPLAAEYDPVPQMDGTKFDAVVSVNLKDLDTQGRPLLIQVTVTVRWKDQRLERQQWFSQYAR